MKKIIAIVALTLMALSATAKEFNAAEATADVSVADEKKLYVYTGGWSHHLVDYEFENTGYDDFNESHNLVGVEYSVVLL